MFTEDQLLTLTVPLLQCKFFISVCSLSVRFHTALVSKGFLSVLRMCVIHTHSQRNNLTILSQISCSCRREKSYCFLCFEHVWCVASNKKQYCWTQVFFCSALQCAQGWRDLALFCTFSKKQLIFADQVYILKFSFKKSATLVDFFITGTLNFFFFENLQKPSNT